MSGVKKRVNHLAVFKQRTKHDDNAELSEIIILSARKTGNLNLSSRGLYTVPNRVWCINELTEEEVRNLHFELDYTHENERWWEQEPLKTLDLSCNNLTAIDPRIECLTDLNALYLQSNMLHTLPAEIGNLKKLKILNLSNNKLEKLPYEFYRLAELHELNLKSNNINQLDPAIGDFIMLTHLEIDMSCLEGVGQLKTLTLGNNQIESIPEEIIKLVYLEIFDLSHNKITLIPSYIGILPNLKQFVIDGNDVQNVRADIIRCGTPRILKHIRQGIESTNLDAKEHVVLDVSTNVYPDRYAMQSTKLLSLAGQNLIELPKEVLENACKADVSTVDLSRNKLSTLPDELCIIANVANLKLISNQLTCIPDWIGEKYKYLQALDLSKNLLQTLPSSFGLLKYLKELNISFNRFEEVPVSVYDVDSLEILIANNNLITNIDATSLQKLQKLAILNLANNNIGHVPPELGNLKNLRNLLLSGNSFKQPRQAILAKSTEEILAYLRNRIPH
ncbi:unnamed protein product [Xylocopa violacea]|uniref:Disease resistance R13L4/SHOC-2-like LRR domain-containing protein n=1 Tax=Xylocopa violacea TaxID=135666 RepID=A0ABP1PGK3_XYLVO